LHSLDDVPIFMSSSHVSLPSDQPFLVAPIHLGTRIGTLLADRGTPIVDFDVLIAAHAASLRCTLVTNNLRHFSKVPGHSVENRERRSIDPASEQDADPFESKRIHSVFEAELRGRNPAYEVEM
jgi:tRNA(fMet)-specific endonuclease VapC